MIISSSKLFQTLRRKTEAAPRSLCCVQLGLQWRWQLRLGNAGFCTVTPDGAWEGALQLELWRMCRSWVGGHIDSDPYTGGSREPLPGCASSPSSSSPRIKPF